MTTTVVRCVLERGSLSMGDDATAWNEAAIAITVDADDPDPALRLVRHAVDDAHYLPRADTPATWIAYADDRAVAVIAFGAQGRATAIHPIARDRPATAPARLFFHPRGAESPAELLAALRIDDTARLPPPAVARPLRSELAFPHRRIITPFMPVQTKICGLTAPDTLDAAIAGGASHVGFVFFPCSPRDLSPDRAGALAVRVPRRVATVGVFVDPSDELLDRVLATALLDAVQLHATAPARVAAIRARTGRETWAAVAIRTCADLDGARALVGAADRILYDAKTPPGAALPGGMGLRFDWSLLDGFHHPLPWALSGGLDAANVGEAIARTRASLVDVSSGVETSPGVKNVDKIAAFLQATAT